MALNLETFKKMSKEEITEYGKTIPEGYTKDENGYVLTFKNSNGFWYEYTYDENGTELTYKNSNGFWKEYTYDKKGNELTYIDSEGLWREYTYDKKGYVLTYKDSDGFWEEYTRDESGNVLTYKNSYGLDIKYLFCGEKYNLGYDKNTKKYKAGCQFLTYEDCEKYYKQNKDNYEDSHNFIEAIRNHQKTLTESTSLRAKLSCLMKRLQNTLHKIMAND